MKYMLLVWLALAACTTKRNPEVCCTTDADCARLGIAPVGCADGFVCTNFACVEAACLSSADCDAARPVCDEPSATCGACGSNSDCDAYIDTPICDASSGGCRACAADADCASEVCDLDTGRCVAEAALIYAAPDGADAAPCTHTTPCSTARALVLATTLPGGPQIRMLPGLYTTAIRLDTPRDVSIVATGATLASSAIGLHVLGGARLVVRGLHTERVSQQVVCEGTASAASALTLIDVVHETQAFALAYCTLSLLRCTTTEAVGPINVRDDGTFLADRTLFRGGLIRTNGARLKVRITNSIFANSTIGLSNNDTAPNISEYRIAFNTFVFGDLHTGLGCTDNSGRPRSAVFENNIFYSAGTSNVVYLGGPCTFTGNLTYPQSPGLSGPNRTADPMLTDVAAGDYRPLPGSPAIDAAGPTSISNLDHDFAGTARPQGAGNDIGAIELVR